MEVNKGSIRKLARTESYDQKLEQRATKHEFLRDRNNITTCRSHGHKLEAEWKTEMQRKRQVEFQRRRHIVQEAPLRDSSQSSQEIKVKMRTNRHKGGSVNRHSFISADELGINWPDVNSPREINRARSEYVTVKEADVLQLADYLREALWREQTVKQKLALLKNTAATLLLSHDNVWKNCSKVDQMKTRIGSLETQLKTCSKRLSRDEAKRLVLQTEQLRQQGEERAIISLKRVMTLKTNAEEKAARLEVALETAHIESTMWKERYEEEKNCCSQLRTLLELHQEPEAELCLKDFDPCYYVTLLQLLRPLIRSFKWLPLYLIFKKFLYIFFQRYLLTTAGSY
ncbi:TRAF3-interacting JNK-activating modulator-like [Aplochiton taeniatus]